MKKILIILILISITTINVKASTNQLYVNLETLEYSHNQKDYKAIKEYKTLESFLNDYKTSNLSSIYITNFLFDGVGPVKTPDLDDFITKGSNNTKIKTLEIKTINIKTTGNIEFTGRIKGYMIAVNTNNQKGNINLILNNVNIDTSTKKAPAIYIYNKDKNYTGCKVTIKTPPATQNYINGGSMKKVSLLPKDELDKYSIYYTKNNLKNYKKYPSYYGIYTSDEINNILFAKVKAIKETLADGDPYYTYKARGAISSDIDLYFEGEGFLKVVSKNKEGIESKANITFSGGTGDYEVYAKDDCINATTPNDTKEVVRNSVTIDVNSLLASVLEDSDEGDAIDSNGVLTINGGTIYAFSHPKSIDAGLDSGTETIINGGTIISTGNMASRISSKSKQPYIFISLDMVEKDTLIVIKDIDDNIVTAFKTNRTIHNIFYSTKDLKSESYKVYTGGIVEGEEKNGLYTNITNYTVGKEISTAITHSKEIINKKARNKIITVTLTEIIIVIIAIKIYKKRKDKS